MPDFLAHRFFRELRSLRLPADDFVICGSGPLFARGWIDDPGDLDIVARGAAWEIVAGLGTVEAAPYSAGVPPLFTTLIVLLTETGPPASTVPKETLTEPGSSWT